MSASRTTVWNVSGGQARPYGPTVNTTRVLFEHAAMWSPSTIEPERISSIPPEMWQPFDIVEERVRERLLGMPCGFTEFTYPPEGREATASDYYATRLNYLKKIGPGYWEFQTMHPYTG